MLKIIGKKSLLKKSIMGFLIATSLMLGCGSIEPIIDQVSVSDELDDEEDKVELADNEIPKSDHIVDLIEQQQGSIQVLGENNYLLENMELNDFDFSIISDAKYLKIKNCNLKNINNLLLLKDLTVLDVSYTFIGNLDGISELSKLKGIAFNHNNIKSVNLDELSKLNLQVINMIGNPLVEREIYDYCITNDIDTNIALEEVNAITDVEEYMKTMNLDGLSNIEKIKVFYQFAADRVNYNTSALNSHELAMEYNRMPLHYALNGNGICINYTELIHTFCQLSGMDSYKSFFEINDLYHTANLIYDSEEGKFVIVDATYYDYNEKVQINDPYSCDSVNLYNSYVNRSDDYNPVLREGVYRY